MNHHTELIHTLKSVYAQIDKDNLELLAQIYQDNIIFIDPFHHIEGLASLTDYFQSLYENLNACQFVFVDEVVSEQQIFLTWTMEYKHPKINRGRTVSLNGCSHLKIDELIYFHRDYFDAGAMLYEHLPILGGSIRWLKRRML